MNQEAQFALRFVVKDLGKMRKAVEQMNQNLAKMQNNANKASKGIDRVNSSMSKAARSVMKFALAYFAVSKVINRVFAKANEAIQLKLMATQAGVAREQIAKLGKALKRYGGDAKSAGSAYASLTDIIGGAQHGEGISEDVQRVNARYGIGFNYGAITQDQLITEIATAMQRQKNRGDQWAVNQIASAYGIDAAMAALLSEHGANWSKVVDAEKVMLPKESETERLIKQEEDMQALLDGLTRDLAPFIKKGLDLFTRLLKWLDRQLEGAKPKVMARDFDENGKFVPFANKNRIPQFNPTDLGKGVYESNGIIFAKNAQSGGTVFNKDLEPIYSGNNSWLAKGKFLHASMFPEKYNNDNTVNVDAKITLENASGTPLKATKTKVGGGLNTVSVNGL